MLNDLMHLTKEYLALWQIIIENSFHSTIAGLHQDFQKQIQSCTFKQLVALPESAGLALITSLVQYYLRDEAKTDAINDRLANECPRLFTNDHANVLKATEIIYSAKKSESSKERQLLVDKAMAILKRHVKRVDLCEISNLLKDSESPWFFNFSLFVRTRSSTAMSTVLCLKAIDGVTAVVYKC